MTENFTENSPNFTVGIFENSTSTEKIHNLDFTESDIVADKINSTINSNNSTVENYKNSTPKIMVKIIS